MAGYECELCDQQEQAAVLITPLVGGETMAVGQDCMAVAFTGMLAGSLGIDAEDLGKAVDRLVKARDRKAAAEATGDRKAAEAEGQDPGAEWRPGIDGPTGDGAADLAALAGQAEGKHRAGREVPA
jgi:hypothetical protein